MLRRPGKRPVPLNNPLLNSQGIPPIGQGVEHVRGGRYNSVMRMITNFEVRPCKLGNLYGIAAPPKAANDGDIAFGSG
jgi:hypothetical protein